MRNNIVLICSILLCSIAARSQTPAQFATLKECSNTVGDCAAYASPADPIPAVYDGTPATVYTDPVFGTKIYRLTPQASNLPCGYRPPYSTLQAWNSDGSLLLLTGSDSNTNCYTAGSGDFLFCGANTGGAECAAFGIPASHYQFIRELPSALAGGDGVDEQDFSWSNSDPCSFFYWYQQTLYLVNVCTLTRSIIIGPLSALTDTQGNILPLLNPNLHIKKRLYCEKSDDDKREGFVVVNGQGYDYGFGVADLSAHSILWFHKITAPGDWVETNAPMNNKTPAWACLSPSGAFMTVNWNQTTKAHSGTEEFDAATGAYISRTSTTWNSFGYGGTLSKNTQTHEDLMRMADGSEALASQFCGSDRQNSSDYELFTAYRLTPGLLLGCPSSAGVASNQMMHAAYGFDWHISGLGSRALPGWALVSTFNHKSIPDLVPQIPYASEIMAVKMDGTNEIRRIAHDQACVANSFGTSFYFAEPHAIPDRQFRRVLFASVWRDCASMTNQRGVNAYIVELPQ